MYKQALYSHSKASAKYTSDSFIPPVTVPTERHLTYARLLRALCIRLSFSPFFLYIASSSPFTPLVPYL
jgi:hypothetical protein